MKRSSSVICGLIAACLLASCNGRGPRTPGDGTVDLSGSGTACSNCYLIGNEGRYSFDATVMGNGKAVEGLDAPSALDPAGARLVWQTSKGMIEDVRFEDGNISFEATGANGNALIAALDADGNIIWSWHIWFPEQQPSTMTTKTGYELMDMNLGAMKPEFDSDDDVKPYGLLYQWGRKDPFTNAPTRTGDTQTVGATVYDADGNEVVFGSSSMTSTEQNTIAFSIANPTVCISNMAQYYTSKDWLEASQGNDALWGNPDGRERDENLEYVNKGFKSLYDPCPAGWRVPPVDVFETFTASGQVSFVHEDFDVVDINGDGLINADDFSNGWMFNMEDGSMFFPAAARFDGSYAMLMGSVCGMWGSYWSNAPGTADYGYGGMGFCALSFQSTMVTPNASASRADAYSVRCVRE